MGCENKNCDKCACDDKIAEPETEKGETFRIVPRTVPEECVVYVEREPEVGFWKFFLGFALGWLFFGC